MWLLLFLIAPCLSLHAREPTPPPSQGSGNDPLEGWLQVRLNHFMASDTRTFPMRYLYNDEFAGHNIVIFIGGGWTISEAWTQTGLAHELAQKLQAGLFYTEHRFYGNTRPFTDTDVTNLQFLSIDQALADLAQFIQHVKSDTFEYGRYKYAKVALVGCAYGGTIATWMRLAYPHLVDAAFSDSGHLHAQEDFSEYLEIVSEAIRTQGSEQCHATIEEAVEGIVQLLATSTGPAQVSQMFNTCTELQAGTPLDVATFFWHGITETFAHLVQYAVPGDITQACQVLTDASVSNPVERLANWIRSHPRTQPCIETRYSEVVARHTNVSYEANDVTMRLWTYQTCVQFGWYQSTSSSRQPFLSTVPLEYFHQMCKDFFSNSFDEENLRAGIARTNIFFSGLSYIPDRVVSVAGGLDPWSPMGPNASHAHHNAPVYVVPEASHCMAIMPTGSSDIEDLEATKLAVLQHMEEFLFGSNYPILSSAVTQGASVVLLLATMFIVHLEFN